MSIKDFFKSASSLSPSAKINLDVNSSSLTSAASSVKSALTDKLSSGGLSIPSLSSVSGSLDNMVGNLRSEIPNFAQQTLERIAPSSLISARTSTTDTKTHSANHDPGKKISNNRSQESSITPLTFPDDLVSRKYYLSLGIGDYTRPTPYLPSTWKPDNYIFLPIPTGLVDATGVTLNQGSNEGTLGHIVEQMASVVTGLGPNASFGNQGIGNAYRELINTQIGTVQTMAQDVTKVVDAIVQTNVTSATQQLLGAIPNPHIQVFFQGVNLRTHSFTYKFAPMTPTESETVQSIVKLLKQSQLPNRKYGAANIMGYPKIVQISLMPDLDKILSINFKKCMIANVTANYSPQGMPSFFAGTKYPTHIELSFQLQEIEVLLSEDYGGVNGDFVGEALGIDINGTNVSVQVSKNNIRGIS